MKKNWNNPELKNLSLLETKDTDCPYPQEATTFTHIPSVDNPFDLLDREKCKYYNDGCIHTRWKANSSLFWPCRQATKKGSNA